MGRLLLIIGLFILGFAGTAAAQQKLEKDVVPTAKGDLEITFLGHASLMMAFEGKVIHVDPYGDVTDYGALPKADIILVTHEHFDHMDLKALRVLLKPATVVIGSPGCAGKLAKAVIMANDESRDVLGLTVESVPAYNIVHKRPGDGPFHPKGSGNGYVVTFADKRIYIAGDTENTAEMKALKAIDIAFLPMNLPYTMSPEEVADAARAFRPKILYPYHYGDTDTTRLVDLLQGEKDIQIRIRKLS